MGVDLRKELLRLLKEDEEFRLAVTGLLGIDEILKAIKSLQEQMVKLQEQVAKQGRGHIGPAEEFRKINCVSNSPWV